MRRDVASPPDLSTHSRMRCDGSGSAATELAPWKFRKAVENAGHAVLFTDADGTIQYVNPAFEETTGYDAEEVIGNDPSLLQSGTHGEAFYADLWATISDGDVWEGELVNQRQDGEEYVIEQTIAPVTRDGERHGYVAINTDITEKWDRERKIRALHGATRDLVDAESFEEAATRVGEAIDAILGFPINVVRLREGTRLVPVHVDEETADLLGSRPIYDTADSPAGDAFAAGETRVYDDVRDVDDDYDRGPVQSWMYVPLGEYGVVSVGQTEPDAFTDTDVRLVEILASNAESVLCSIEQEQELLRENERLQRFASTVSHDLRNPLNVAEGTLDQMRNFTEQLDRMRRAHERMEEVIEGVLTLARQGERVEESVPVDVPTLASKCWNHVSTPGASLVVEGETDEFDVEGDDARCKHLFENLFRNAITHGDAETVTVGPLDDGGFFVADDGTGIPPDQREDVFTAGYTTATQGTGLGLSIVQEIADAHDWDAALTESEDGGARFEFRPHRSYCSRP